MTSGGSATGRAAPGRADQTQRELLSRALRELGWMEGRNLILEVRFGGTDPERHNEAFEEFLGGTDP